MVKKIKYSQWVGRMYVIMKYFIYLFNFINMYISMISFGKFEQCLNVLYS